MFVCQVLFSFVQAGEVSSRSVISFSLVQFVQIFQRSIEGRVGFFVDQVRGKIDVYQFRGVFVFFSYQVWWFGSDFGCRKISIYGNRGSFSLCGFQKGIVLVSVSRFYCFDFEFFVFRFISYFIRQAFFRVCVGLS